MEDQVNNLLTQALESYEESKRRFGDQWVLSKEESIKEWLRGYNANEHNNKLYTACLEKLKEMLSCTGTD